MSLLALAVGYGLVFWLFRIDMGWRRASSAALWVPGLYLAAAGSRPPSFWLNIGGDSNLEGSPVNLLYNGMLICAAVLILGRRQMSWGAFAKQNKALTLIYLYFAASALWSEFPLATSKRLINDFLCVLVALVILTDQKPGEALRIVFVRVAYLLLPMSIVAIRYFPNVGRQFSHAFEYMYTGVTDHKNSLGALTMVLGLIMLWDFMETSEHGPAPRTKLQRWSRMGVFPICLYLLVICHSATSLACFILGIFLLLASKRLARMKNAKQVLIGGFAASLSLLACDKIFGVSDIILDALGRDSTLTGRTEIWKMIHEKNVNIILGSGFRGFWESKAGESVYEQLNINRLLTAHNGYLEAYLNGGLLGAALLIVLLLSMGGEAIKKLLVGDALGRISLVIWIIALIHNMSESSFFIDTPLWMILMLVTIDHRGLVPAPTGVRPSGEPEEQPV